MPDSLLYTTAKRLQSLLEAPPYTFCPNDSDDQASGYFIERQELQNVAWLLTRMMEEDSGRKPSIAPDVPVQATAATPRCDGQPAGGVTG